MARLATIRLQATGVAGLWAHILLFAGVLAVPLLIVVRNPPVEGALVIGAGVAMVSLMAARDARTLHVPNGLVMAGAGMVLVAAFAAGIAAGMEALAGAAVALGAMAVLVAASRGAMGWGDAKVGAVCGMVVGVGGVVPMLLGAWLLGGAVAVVALASGVRGRKDAVAYTPFLLAGVLVALAGFPVYAVG